MTRPDFLQLEEVRTALADACDIDGVTAYDYVPDSINVPAVVVGWPQAWAFHRAFVEGLEGSDDIPVRVLVSRGDAQKGQLALARFIDEGPTSIREAIERDQTLGGRTVQVICRYADSFGVSEVAGNSYYGCTFHVMVR